eukprot:GHVR01033111.1.p1 GENE.GHVR01033111.1~~GHVR01033111.1.p1  ORF type:complete len:596 (+),score=27.35 GHVR01033111.1:13-1800(+)
MNSFQSLVSKGAMDLASIPQASNPPPDTETGDLSASHPKDGPSNPIAVLLNKKSATYLPMGSQPISKSETKVLPWSATGDIDGKTYEVFFPTNLETYGDCMFIVPLSRLVQMTDCEPKPASGPADVIPITDKTYIKIDLELNSVLAGFIDCAVAIAECVNNVTPLLYHASQTHYGKAWNYLVSCVARLGSKGVIDATILANEPDYPFNRYKTIPAGKDQPHQYPVHWRGPINIMERLFRRLKMQIVNCLPQGTSEKSKLFSHCIKTKEHLQASLLKKKDQWENPTFFTKVERLFLIDVFADFVKIRATCKNYLIGLQADLAAGNPCTDIHFALKALGKDKYNELLSSFGTIVEARAGHFIERKPQPKQKVKNTVPEKVKNLPSQSVDDRVKTNGFRADEVFWIDPVPVLNLALLGFPSGFARELAVALVPQISYMTDDLFDESSAFYTAMNEVLAGMPRSLEIYADHAYSIIKNFCEIFYKATMNDSNSNLNRSFQLIKNSYIARTWLSHTPSLWAWVGAALKENKPFAQKIFTRTSAQREKVRKVIENLNLKNADHLLYKRLSKEEYKAAYPALVSEIHTESKSIPVDELDDYT